jgi:hypothetical protein
MTTVLAGTSTTRTVDWLQYDGGPHAAVTDVTVKVVKVAGGSVVLTATPATHIATGQDSFTWAIPAGTDPGDYTFVWDGTDEASQPVEATETITVAGSLDGPLYLTVAELREHLDIKADDTSYDSRLLARITAASRQVDQDCNRVGTGFGLDPAASPRTYKPEHPEVLLVDDISTPDGVIVEVGLNTSWSTIDPNGYEFRPENCWARGLPANVLARLYGAWPLYFGPGSYLQQRVRVTAVWGWAAVPAQIHDATLLRAARLFRRKASPEGVAGFGDLGVVRVSRMDPDYDALIKDFILDEL